MSQIGVIFILEHVASLLTLLFFFPQHNPRPDRPSQPATRTGLPEERRGSLHSFRQMDKSAEHAQPSHCQQAHMMACKIKRQGKMACFNTSIKYATVLLQVYPLIQDTQHRFLRMPPISRRLQEPRERVQSVLFCGDERKSLTLIFVFHVPDWQILPCATHKCFSC